MARFDLHHVARTGYLTDVQNHLLNDFGRRVVIPLLSPASLPKPIPDLHPILLFREQPYVLVTQRVASVPKSRLGPPIANLAQYRDEIVRALDVLFIGF